jgi:uncharacterized protein (DUF779 family)
MNVTVTEAAETMIRRVRAAGRENLIMVLGTGCCDSTSPFLYDNYLPEPDAQPVGSIDGVEILAPKWLAELYPGGEGLVVDVDAGVVNDSLSLESEYDARFTLRVPERRLQN